MVVGERHIRYFTPDEFIRDGENWFDKCSPRLLILLDTFRHLTGTCIISPHDLAIGRRSYKRSASQHSYDTYGEVRGIDVFPNFEPSVDIEVDSSVSRYYVNNWIEVAKELNFTGIGFYPNWTYKGETRPGLHLDVREGELTTWGYVDGKMVSIETALEAL